MAHDYVDHTQSFDTLDTVHIDFMACWFVLFELEQCSRLVGAEQELEVLDHREATNWAGSLQTSYSGPHIQTS